MHTDNYNYIKTMQNTNFIISSESTDTCQLKTGFYGLTDKPAEFQKAIDYTLKGLQNTLFLRHHNS